MREVSYLGAIALAISGLFLLTFLARETLPGKAPEIAFHSIGGETIRLTDLRGHPVLVTFWASDCRTCLMEIPEWERIHREFSTRGLHLVAVAMSYDMPSRVFGLVKARALPYTVALDPIGKIAEAFDRVELVPTTFLIAPDGTIRFRGTGALDFRSLREQMTMMLGGS